MISSFIDIKLMMARACDCYCDVITKFCSKMDLIGLGKIRCQNISCNKIFFLLNLTTSLIGQCIVNWVSHPNGLHVRPCIVKLYRAPLIFHQCRTAIFRCFTTCKFGAEWSNVDLQISKHWFERLFEHASPFIDKSQSFQLTYHF